MWGYRCEVVDSTVVDQFEAALQTKLEIMGGFNTSAANVLYKVFGEFDLSRSGKTDLVEFEHALERLNFLNKKREIKALFRRYDIDNDGIIDYRDMGLSLTRDSPSRSIPAIGRFREFLGSRCGGYQALADLKRALSSLDRNRSGMLDKGDLMRSVVQMLNSFGVYLSPSHIEDLCPYFERTGDGRMRYDEFIDAVCGPMHPHRVALVKMAFDSLDTERTGAVTLAHVGGQYDVSHHPRVRSQQIRPRDASLELMRVFDKSAEQLVSFDEFLGFYRWISPNIDSDEYFEFMMRSAWHIPGISQQLPAGELRLLVAHRDGLFSIEHVRADASTDPAVILSQLRSLRGIDALHVDIAF
eukprot:Opistho-2@52374